MSITVYVPLKPQHYYWEGVFNEEDVRRFLRKLKDPSHYSWVTDRKWANSKLEELLKALVKMDVPTCHLGVYPYKHEIEVYIKGPDDPGGGGPHKTISYEEEDSVKRITKMIAEIVRDYWKERIKGPVKMSKKVFACCAKYLG